MQANKFQGNGKVRLESCVCTCSDLCEWPSSLSVVRLRVLEERDEESLINVADMWA